MKRFICVLLSFCLLCGIIVHTLSVPENTTILADSNEEFKVTNTNSNPPAQSDYIRVNVKDFGAVGDGQTDDKAAIIAAFEYAIDNLPATVYFPKGIYGLASGGIYIKLPLGAGGLNIQGESSGQSVIRYLDQWQPNGAWVAIRVMPNATPSDISEYIHDVTISDMAVEDTNPLKHAWTVENNGTKEETHGFDIQHCIRATVRDCGIYNVGDEAIDMVYCIDSIITDNIVEGSPGAGSAGGAISAGDGCKNIRIVNNTVNKTVNDDSKTNFGIAIESLFDPISNIIISNNTITDIYGYAINIGAPKGKIDNIVVDGNTISDCRIGVHIGGNGEKSNISITDNVITNVNSAISESGGKVNQLLIDNFVIENSNETAIKLSKPSTNNVIISNGIIKNAKTNAIYNASKNVKLRNITIDSVGLQDNTTAAILQYAKSGDSEVSDITIKNCLNKKAIQGVQTVINANVEQTEIKGYASIAGAETIRGGKVNRIIQGLKSGATIDGLEINTQADLGTNAIQIADATGCIITNCRITMPKSPSRYAIRETGTSDYNIITNNIITNCKLVTIGANSINSNNIKF